MQPTAKPKAGRRARLVPEFSIASLNSHPILPADCGPATLTPALTPPRKCATLERGAKVSVQHLLHQIRPAASPRPIKSRPAPILPCGGQAPPMQRPLFPWSAPLAHPLQPPSCRTPPRSITDLPKPHALPVNSRESERLTMTQTPPQQLASHRPATCPVFRTTVLGPQAASQATQRGKCVRGWEDLLSQVGLCSTTYATALASQSRQAAYEASLRAFTPSTLAQYFRWHPGVPGFCASTNLSVGEIELVHLVDLMHACESSHDEDRPSVRIAPRSMLKALSWLGRVGQVHLTR